MSFPDDRPTRDNEGWRFHARIPSSIGAQSAAPSAAASSQPPTPRYSRTFMKKMSELKDGEAARFQADDACFMLLRIGSEFYVRPFGEGSDIRVNDVPATGLTRVTLDDRLQIGRRCILLRRPPEEERSNGMDDVDKLTQDPQESIQTKAKPSVPNFVSGGSAAAPASPASSPAKKKLNFEKPELPPRERAPIADAAPKSALDNNLKGRVLHRAPSSTRNKKLSFEKKEIKPRNPKLDIYR